MECDIDLGVKEVCGKGRNSDSEIDIHSVPDFLGSSSSNSLSFLFLGALMLGFHGTVVLLYCILLDWLDVVFSFDDSFNENVRKMNVLGFDFSSWDNMLDLHNANLTAFSSVHVEVPRRFVKHNVSKCVCNVTLH